MCRVQHCALRAGDVARSVVEYAPQLGELGLLAVVPQLGLLAQGVVLELLSLAPCRCDGCDERSGERGECRYQGNPDSQPGVIPHSPIIAESAELVVELGRGTEQSHLRISSRSARGPLTARLPHGKLALGYSESRA